MTKCDKCLNKNNRRICKICDDYDCFEEKAITNAERIRRMSDAELAKFIASIKCNTFSKECGYPACTSMEGKYCLSMCREPDLDILNWLQSDKQPIFRKTKK